MCPLNAGSTTASPSATCCRENTPRHACADVSGLHAACCHPSCNPASWRPALPATLGPPVPACLAAPFCPLHSTEPCTRAHLARRWRGGRGGAGWTPSARLSLPAGTSCPKKLTSSACSRVRHPALVPAGLCPAAAAGCAPLRGMHGMLLLLSASHAAARGCRAVSAGHHERFLFSVLDKCCVSLPLAAPSLARRRGHAAGEPVPPHLFDDSQPAAGGGPEGKAGRIFRLWVLIKFLLNAVIKPTAPNPPRVQDPEAGWGGSCDCRSLLYWVG